MGAMAVVSPFFVNHGTLGRDGGFMLSVSALLFVLGMVGMIDRPVGIALFVILIGFTYYLYTSAREVEDTAEAEAGVDETAYPAAHWWPQWYCWSALRVLFGGLS